MRLFTYICFAYLMCILPLSARENYALLIGASTYENLDERFWLVGPANDVDLVQTYLVTNPHVPFDARNIWVLADGVAGGTAPTLAAIRGAMADLARTAKKDDFVYLHFSGHGSQAPALHPDSELDGLDELFLPVDIGPWNDAVGEVENALVDDEIGEMIGRIRATGATVWAVFDSCHSGTVTRAAAAGDDDVRLRKLGPEALGIPDSAMQVPATRGVGDSAESGSDPVQAEGAFVAFYAAQTTETTPEKRLPRGVEGRRSQGVFTFTLFETLVARPGVTYRQLAQDVLRRYAVNNLARSTPLFEGDLDLTVFGTETTEAIRQWPLIDEGDSYSITAGHLHGIEDGMLLSVMASPADPDSEAVGQMRVDFAETFRAEVVGITASADRIPRGAYLRQTDQSASFSLSIALPDPDSEIAQRLEKAIDFGKNAELFGPRIRFVSRQDEADLRLALRPEGEHPEAIWVLPATGILADTGFARTPRINTAEKTPEEIAEALSDTLIAISRVQNLLKLGGAFHGDALDVDIDLRTRSPSNPRFSALDTVPVPDLVPDDEIHVIVRNQEAVPLDLNVLYVGSDYSISHMFAGRLQPGDRLKQGLLRITDEAFGRDRVVMILTPAARQSAVEDLSFLAQKELPVTRSVSDDSFAATLAEAGFGHTTRSAKSLSGGALSGLMPAMLVYDINTRPAQ